MRHILDLHSDPRPFRNENKLILCEFLHLRTINSVVEIVTSFFFQQLLARMSNVREEGVEKVGFPEFAQYVIEHEKQLEKIFEELDRNKDGL